ncbi:hypothetical protein B5V01_07990 [Mesorhizobium erdmanii]|uniref:Uncharacterized protein n=2 Tax=Mesorhizobium TaxID=68287 RepID=A0A3M9X419_9HYPH|nr:hypothetical protein DNR46_28940 [Mesorhizobium japonicum]RXT47900.1 hypothetical protein B5V01_07990 [Mesorhizobium erdmanii]
MTKLSDLGPPVTATRQGYSPKEGEHFSTCPVCGQPVDMRDLKQVIWHDKPVHERLDIDA